MSRRETQAVFTNGFPAPLILPLDFTALFWRVNLHGAFFL